MVHLETLASFIQGGWDGDRSTVLPPGSPCARLEPQSMLGKTAAYGGRLRSKRPFPPTGPGELRHESAT